MDFYIYGDPEKDEHVWGPLTDDESNEWLKTLNEVYDNGYKRIEIESMKSLDEVTQIIRRLQGVLVE